MNPADAVRFIRHLLADGYRIVTPAGKDITWDLARRLFRNGTPIPCEKTCCCPHDDEEEVARGGR